MFRHLAPQSGTFDLPCSTVVLQPRRVLDSLKELLDAGGNGPITIAVWGPLRSGMTTLRQDGWRKVLQGITTVEEVAR